MTGTPNNPEGMDLPPLNEWVVDELTRTRDTLSDLMERHERILNNLAAVCRENDELRAAGTELSSFVGALIDILYNSTHMPGGIRREVLMTEAKQSLDRWRNANA